jgi:Rhodopirellula transposase DDE domain
MGSVRYPHAEILMIAAEGGGSSHSRLRLWKIALREIRQRARPPTIVGRWNGRVDIDRFTALRRNCQSYV